MKNLYPKILMLIIFTAFSSLLNAQNNNIGIGTGTPDASAMLEILSANKGLLVPRMTATERLAIVTPANALLVYDTDSACFLFYDLPNTEWINLCNAFAETDPEVGANTTDQIPKWNGTELVSGTITDSLGRIGIGTTNPKYLLNVKTSGQGISHEAADTAIQIGTFVDGTYGAFLQTHTNHPLNLAANNAVARLTIMPHGNIGIGTTDPTQKLDVNGKIRIRNLALDNTKDSILVASGDGTVAYRDASSILAGGLHTLNKVPKWNGSALVSGSIYDSLGLVGIGTTTPTGLFHLYGPGSLGAGARIVLGDDYYFTTEEVNTFIGEFGWQDSTDSDILQVHGKLGTRFTYGGNFSLNPIKTGIALDASGNVGIGTTTPNADFHVFGNAIFGESTDTLPSANTRAFFRYRNGNTRDATVVISAGNCGGTCGQPSPTTGLSLFNSNATNNERIGIGFGEKSTNTNEYAYWVGLQRTGAAESGTGDLYFKSGNGGIFTNRVVFKDNGNVGVGTTTPEARLHISAGALATGNATVSPQTLINLGWTEGNQNLGKGEGKAIAFMAKLIGDANNYTVARIGSYKVSSSDGTRTSDLVFETSDDGTATPTEKVRIAYNGNMGVGTSTPASSALLEVSSTTKGFLPPRMTNNERAAIASPTQGLIIYCTNCGTSGGEPQYYNGTDWVNLIGGTRTAGPPLVTTTPVTSIVGISAQCGGNATADVSGGVSLKGVCWSTNPNPTISDFFTTSSGSGSFSHTLTGLITFTTYYVRAYASNPQGTNYGNEFSFTTPAMPAIGTSIGGGKLAYILQPGDPGYDANVQHGLIAAFQDQSIAAYWGCDGTNLPGADGTALGTGAQNTIDIEAGCSTSGIAADICANLVLNGYSDWYLPSIDELHILYINRGAIGNFQFLPNISDYLSSSEKDDSSVFSKYFYLGQTGTFGKSPVFTARVRAVRSF